MTDGNPLIVTLEIDRASLARFERERDASFPAERRVVGAHVTLFHALPARIQSDVVGGLEEEARRPAFTLRVREPYSLGGGVAYRLQSPEIELIHRRLQQRWRAHLTRQDRQPLRPHITVQNRVTPEEARATLSRLRQGFHPLDARALGFQLWRYEGGPWTHLRRFRFSASGEPGNVTRQNAS